MRRVWILGAGFSRPLGGPLLPDLLSETMQTQIRVRHPDATALVTSGTRLYKRYRRGLRTEWADAEQFLVFLERAAVDGTPQHRQLSKSNVPVDCAQFDRVARRLVAAECSAFIHGESVDSEHWLPFRAWGSAIDANDTLISFNYDLVLEHLRQDSQRLAALKEQDWDVPPIRRVENTKPINPGAARLYKLHGSVDWKLGDDGTFSVAKPWWFLNDIDSRLGISTPGHSKMGVSQQAFRFLWDGAMQAIRDAERVIMLGYRIPETDAFARHQLLSALRESRAVVHVALGPSSPDARRLEHLLNGISKVVVHELWTQDFLARWTQLKPDSR